MSAETKAVNLTETEIEQLINWHGCASDDSIEDRLERMNYLNKRLKAFKEPEVTVGSKQGNSAEAVTQGWPTNG